MQASVSGDLALVGATIYSGPDADPVRNGVVLIHAGEIAAVGGRAEVAIPHDLTLLDCSGRTVTAGFWNSHVHFFERKWANAAGIASSDLGRQLQDMLTRYGFTSVFDTGSQWENTRRIRGRIESGEVDGPKIRSTGEGLVPPGALPSDTVLRMMGAMNFPAPEIADAAQAADAAARLLEQGVDAIKLFASSPRSAPLPESAMQSAVMEARRVSKPVFVHPNTAADVLTSVRAGVDIVAHTTPQSGPWDEALLALMKERRVALTPTLTLWRFYLRHDLISTQEQTVNTAIGQLRAWLACGGTVLFGTDLGAVDYDPTEEYLLMSAAGMDFRDILASLTTAPAARFGQAHSGHLRPGEPADLVILKDDPAGDIRALAGVQCTLRAGRIIYRAGGGPL